jgi:hypothetical protein
MCSVINRIIGYTWSTRSRSLSRGSRRDWRVSINVIVPSELSPGVQRLTWIGPDGALTVSNIAVK